jgi:hypothetical protein
MHDSRNSARGAAAPALPASNHAVLELTLTSNRPFSNPYTSVKVTGTFVGPRGVRNTIPGFWDGGRMFKIRFTPTAEGTWTYRVTSAPADDGLSQTGRIHVGPSPAGNHGFLRRDPRHPYSFVWDDGTRYFMWGQTYYQIVVNAMAGGGWRTAIDGTASYRMNKVRLLLTPWCSSTPRSRPYPCVRPFVGGDHDVLNVPYWRKLDEIVQYLEARHIVADLVIFTDSATAFGNQAQDERYLRYAVARFGAYHHVIWTLTNEWNYTKRPQSYWNTMGWIVRREDPWGSRDGSLRPLSIHQQTRMDFQFFESRWPVHAVIQFGLRNGGSAHGDEWGNVAVVFNRRWRMPVVNDEYGYIGEAPQRTVTNYDRDQHRRVIWGIALGGGYGSAGDCGMNACDRTAPIFTGDWIDRPEYRDIRHLVDFWTTKGIQYWTMAPSNHLVAGSARVYVLAAPGREYVAYTATGAPFALRLAAGTYAFEWFNPSTGIVAASGTLTAGRRNRPFDPPFAGDAVLYLRKR